MATATATTAKTKTCPRCKGKGIVSSPVVHCGVAGGCYQCGMQGVVRWASRDERNARIDENASGQLQHIEDYVAEYKARFEMCEYKVAYQEMVEAHVQEYRDEWLTIKQGKDSRFKHVTRGEWVRI